MTIRLFARILKSLTHVCCCPDTRQIALDKAPTCFVSWAGTEITDPLPSPVAVMGAGLLLTSVITTPPPGGAEAGVPHATACAPLKSAIFTLPLKVPGEFSVKLTTTATIAATARAATERIPRLRERGRGRPGWAGTTPPGTGRSGT